VAAFKSVAALLFVPTDTFAAAPDAFALSLDASANFAAASVFATVSAATDGSRPFSLFAAAIARPACLLASCA
jgi:hypothetical protein